MFSIPFIDLPPLVAARGTVRLPGSKSISNRVLLLAALSEGTTTLHGLLDSDDTRVMLDALRAIGCRVEAGKVDKHGAATWQIEGLAGCLPVREAELFLGNSGTATRSIAAALAVLASMQSGRFLVGGVARMHERPIGDLVDALRPLGCVVGYQGAEGFPPLRLGDGSAHVLDLARPIRVRGGISSQFLTGLLQALAAAAAEVDHDIVIEIDGPLISQPYVAITLEPARSVRRGGSRRRGCTVHHSGRQSAGLAGRFSCRGRRLVGVVFRGARRDRRQRRGAAAH